MQAPRAGSVGGAACPFRRECPPLWPRAPVPPTPGGSWRGGRVRTCLPPRACATTWRGRAHRPICTWSRVQEKLVALQVPSLRRPRFLPPSPAPGTSRQLGRGAGTARAVGPVQPPPKHRTQVPHSCAKPRLGPGGLWPRDCWLSRPEGLVPGSRPAVPAGIGEQTGWCCPWRHLTPSSDPGLRAGPSLPDEDGQACREARARRGETRSPRESRA